MSSWKLLRLAVPVVVVALLAAGVAFAASAKAQTPPSLGASHERTLDPRKLPATLPHGVFRASDSRSTTSRRAGMTTNNDLILSDLALYVTNDVYTSLAAEGHLLLTNDHGAHYAGTFVDDLSGASIFTASASHIQPTGLSGSYTINTGNGTFTFVIGGSFTSTVPAKYGSQARIGTVLYSAHSYTQRTPLSATFSSTTVGGFHRPASGTLTLTTDALGYIVPFSTKRHVNSSWNYTIAGHLKSYKISSLGRYNPPTGSGGGGLTTVLKVDTTVFHVVGAAEDSGGQRIIRGNAMAGSGDATSESTFSAH